MKKAFIIILLSFIGFAGYGQSKVQYNKALADSLESWVKVDQIAANIPQGKFKDLSKEQWQAYKDSVFGTHKRLLDGIYNKYGYPGQDLVGEKGAHHYWLMAQHCDSDPAFQQKILNALKKQVDKANASAIDYAYLTDRVNLNTGKKQLYGTQVTYNLKTCQAYPKPVADSVNLNARRKAIKLPPVEEYLNTMSEMHFMMNKTSYEEKGIKEAKLYVVSKD